MDYFFLLFAIVIVIFMIMLYYYFSSNRTVLYGNQVLLNSSSPTMSLAKITDLPGTRNYTISLWVYLLDWAADGYNVIMNINSDGKANSTSKLSSNKTLAPYVLYLDKQQPNLIFYVPSKGASAANGDITISNNFPVQSWVFVSISMQGNQGDFYINGKLLRSQNVCPKGSTICAAVDTIELGASKAGITKTTATSSPNMYIANVQRLSSPSNPQQVWTSYLAGNGVSSLNMTSYGAEFGLTQNGQVINNFKI